MDQGERNWELFLLPVAVRDDDIGAPVLAAPVPGKSFKVDPRRANLLPKWVSIIIELPSKYAAIVRPERLDARRFEPLQHAAPGIGQWPCGHHEPALAENLGGLLE